MNTNELAFIALSNEYCSAVENSRQTERDEFIRVMLRLLPRLYIAATDLTADCMFADEACINPALDEDTYEAVRASVAMLMGEDDTYLEVFEQDMKYSDTPIAASVAEGLTDIFQSLYNLLDNIKDATDEVVTSALAAAKEDFETYWSRILCNVLRPLNEIRYNNEQTEP